MEALLEVEMTKGKDTKNTVVYNGPEDKLPTLYIPKAVLGTKRPAKIVVAIAVED